MNAYYRCNWGYQVLYYTKNIGFGWEPGGNRLIRGYEIYGHLGITGEAINSIASFVCMQDSATPMLPADMFV